MRSLEGQTALVTGGGKDIGRAVSLALSARGVRIVVTGRDEKALGETVGEIAHGGGKARHVVGDVRDPIQLGAAADRAIEVFGGLNIVILCHAVHFDEMGAECTFSMAMARLPTPGRLLVATAHADPSITSAVREHATALFAKGITCNAILLEGVEDASMDIDDAAASVGELVVFLCGRAADGITGQAISIRAATG